MKRAPIISFPFFGDSDGTRLLSAPLTALALATTAHAAPPANDDFADAIELAGDSGTLSGNNNIDATKQAGEPDCVYAATDNTVWFKWTCTTAGNFNLDTSGSTSQASGEWDACVAIYTGSELTALTKVNEVDTIGAENLTVSVSPGVYYIQLGGFYDPTPDVATDINLTWEWTEGPAPTELEGNLSDTLDNVVGAILSARLIGDTMTYWPGTTSTSDIDLNGWTLTLDNGNGNGQTYNGTISGPGILAIDGSPNANFDPDVRVGGGSANTPDSVLLVEGRATLNKTVGVNAFAGPITVGPNANAKRIALEAPDQIDDASTLDATTGAGAFELELNGHHEGFASLNLKAGDVVDTGVGGVLNVDSLTVDGVVQPKGAYTAGGSAFVQGTGYIDVDSFGPPVINDPPDAPTSPVPADTSSDIHPAYFSMLTWSISDGANEYDLYLWLASESKPASPTATVPSNEYTLPADLESLEDYQWQVVARNSVGETDGPVWSFSTVARWELSGIQTEVLDAIVGEGNTGQLVADARTHWNVTNSISDVELNGFQLTLHNGGGNPQTYAGAFAGPGTLRIDGRSSADWDPDIQLEGGEANTPTTVILNSGRVSLAKSSGVDALAGPITTAANDSTKRIWLKAGDQINDTSTLDTTDSSGLFVFNLNGFTETIGAASLAVGHLIDTGNGGVLTVDTLTIDGTPVAAGTYDSTSGSDFVSGTGSVVVLNTAVSGFDAWASAKGLSGADAEFEADPDGDGLSNILEFVLGGEPNPANPDSNSLDLMPIVEVVGDDFVFTFSRMDESAYLDPVVEFNTSLQDPWTTAFDPGNASISVSDGSPADTVTVSIPRNGATEMFARLRVDAP